MTVANPLTAADRDAALLFLAEDGESLVRGRLSPRLRLGTNVLRSS